MENDGIQDLQKQKGRLKILLLRQPLFLCTASNYYLFDVANMWSACFTMLCSAMARQKTMVYQVCGGRVLPTNLTYHVNFRLMVLLTRRY